MTTTGAVQVRIHGVIEQDDVTYAVEKVEHALARVEIPILATEVKLTHAGDPARERPYVAEATVDVNGTVLRGHVAADTMREAGDLLAARLSHRVEHLLDRLKRPRRQQRHAERDPHEWHHGDPPTERPAWFQRDPDERELLRRKSFAPGPQTPDEAADTMALLGHEFFLFPNLATGADALLWRDGDGLVLSDAGGAAAEAMGEVVTPMAIDAAAPRTATVDEARSWLDTAEQPFVFFVDEGTGRGSVAYRRYDGHDGLVTLA